MTEIARPIFFVLKAILNLQLCVRCETIAGCDIRAPHVVPPRSASSVSIWHVAEKLLVPANGAEKLRRKFIFPLEIPRKGVRVADAWDFETRFVEFRPELQMTPGKTDVLAQNALMKIADVAAVPMMAPKPSLRPSFKDRPLRRRPANTSSLRLLREPDRRTRS